MYHNRDFAIAAGLQLVVMSCSVMTAGAEGPGNADDRPAKGVHGMVFLGGGFMPDFEGAAEYAPMPLAMATLKAYGVELQIKGPEASLNLRPDAMFQLGPMAGYSFGREDVSNKVVDRLEAIDGAFEVGGFAKVRFDSLLAQSDALELSADLMADITGGTEGVRGTLGVSYTVAVTQRFMVGADIAAGFASDSYMDTYFGVSAIGAARSGLPSYTASGGFKNVSVGAIANFALTERWGVFGRMEYSRLLGDAADSPIVKREGSADQFMGGLGLSYSF